MYYVFIGQLNTTIGTPHKKTGLYNIYGDLKAFKTIKDRDNYYNNFINKSFLKCVKTNKSEAKSKYFAGLTQRAYIQYLELVDNGYINAGD